MLAAARAAPALPLSPGIPAARRPEGVRRVEILVPVPCAGPFAARGRVLVGFVLVCQGPGVGNGTSEREKDMDSVFYGCGLLQLTSVQPDQLT